MHALWTLLRQDDGLTLGDVLANVPHDGPAVVIYLMGAVFLGLVWAGSRKGKGTS
jgi:hypothetical protein